MKNILLIFLGGGIGSCLRYLVSSWLSALALYLPLGTLLSNILACLILGCFVSLFEAQLLKSEEIRLLVMIGICGGFSTFSTFSSELFTYWKNEQYNQLLIYTLLSLVACHLSIFLGIWAGKSLFMIK
jgi:fluoride exporter